jgi:hypothetical protein
MPLWPTIFQICDDLCRFLTVLCRGLCDGAESHLHDLCTGSTFPHLLLMGVVEMGRANASLEDSWAEIMGLHLLSLLVDVGCLDAYR